jgi:dihydroflavonol-4-reductase
MIAVTGSNGLLGSYVIRKLLEEKRQFVALKRENSDLSLLADVNHLIQWRIADVLDPVSLDESFKGASCVIHAAALVSFNPAKAKQLYNVNVEGTRNVVNACLQNNINKLIHISSVAALGRQKGQTLIDESNKWSESSLNSFYAESKYLAELEVYRAKEEGLQIVILNPSVILAAADWTKSSAQLFRYVWQEKPYYIDSTLNYVDGRDVAKAALQFVDFDQANGRYILNAGSINFTDFFSAVAKLFNKKPPSILLKNNFLRVAATLETLRSRITGSDPLVSIETARLAGSHFFYSNEKIKKTLNFQFQTLTETLAWCAPYYLNYLSKK